MEVKKTLKVLPSDSKEPLLTHKLLRIVLFMRVQDGCLMVSDQRT